MVWEQSFDLEPGTSTRVADPSARHLHWSIAETARPVLRDLRAVAERPLDALLVGCGEGYLAHRMLEWGTRRVVLAESRPDVLARARFVREHLGFAPERLEIRATQTPAELAVAGERFDIAIVDWRPGRLGRAPGALELISACADSCLLISPDRLEGATALRAAGFGKPTLLEPPADSQRQLIAYEVNLMVARPAAPAPA